MMGKMPDLQTSCSNREMIHKYAPVIKDPEGMVARLEKIADDPRVPPELSQKARRAAYLLEKVYLHRKAKMDSISSNSSEQVTSWEDLFVTRID